MNRSSPVNASPTVRRGPPALQGQRGQVQPDRPPLGPPDQLVDLRVGEPDTGRLQQGPRLLPVHRQLADPDLHHLALSAQQRHRQRRRAPGGQRQLRPRGKPQRPARRPRPGTPGSRATPGGRGPGQPAGSSPRPRTPTGAPRWPRPRRPGEARAWNDPRVDRLDPVQRDGDVGQQHHRVVVALVDRDPSHPVPLARAPLGQQGRLAVAGRGDDTDDRHRRAASSRSTSAGRGTIPGRADRGRSFDSTRSKDGPGRVRRVALQGRHHAPPTAHIHPKRVAGRLTCSTDASIGRSRDGSRRSTAAASDSWGRQRVV